MNAPSNTLPDVSIKAPGEAEATLPAAGEAVLSAIMIRALRAHADTLAEDRIAKTVSISVDVTGETFDGGTVSMKTKTDRQTRTLIFMNGIMRAGDTALLKATAIFRLADAD